jgi:hypothetical protein
MAMPMFSPGSDAASQHLVAVATSTAYHLQNIHAHH